MRCMRHLALASIANPNHRRLFNELAVRLNARRATSAQAQTCAFGPLGRRKERLATSLASGSR